MFERESQALYFGVTPVENIFLTEYMPAARGEYVKVFLSCLYHAGIPGDESRVEDIAKELDMNPSEVESALRYWQRRGLMVETGGQERGYRIRSAVERSVSGGAIRADGAFVTFSENLYQLFGDSRKLRPSEISMAYDWVEEEGLMPEAVYALIRHMRTMHGAQFAFRTAGKLAAQMHDAGVVTGDDAESWLGFEENVHRGAQAVLRRLGRRRLPSEDELDLYRKWIRAWGFSAEDVLEACRETTAAGDPTFRYLDGILGRLKESGTEKEVSARLAEDREDIRLTAEMLGALGNRASPASVLPVYRELSAALPHDLIVFAASQCMHAGCGTLEAAFQLAGAGHHDPGGRPGLRGPRPAAGRPFIQGL